MSFLIGLYPQTAHAATGPSIWLAQTMLDAATNTTYRNSLAICLSYNNNQGVQGGAYGGPRGGGYHYISASDIADGKWFNGNVQVRQWFDYNNGDNGTNCDKLAVSKMLSALGWSDTVQAACDLGFTRQDGKDCLNSPSDDAFRRTGISKKDAFAAIDSHYTTSIDGNSYTPKQYYVMAASILQTPCKIQQLATTASATPEQKAKGVEIQAVDNTGNITSELYQITGGGSTKWSFKNDEGTSGDSNFYTYTCSSLVKWVNDNASAYAQWVKANQPGANGTAGTCDQYALNLVGGVFGRQTQQDKYNKIVAACQDGLTNKSKPNYCNKYPTINTGDTYVDNAANVLNDACVYGQTKATLTPPPTTSGTVDGGTQKPTCAIDGIGWVVCPIMTFMAKINDKAYSFLASNFLSVDTGIVTGTKDAWTKFRDIANVAFVIVFMIVIYSQVTSGGISNYGIKRMLPRLIAGAILVNVSFYICEIAVDLSNLLGYGIPQFFGSVPVGERLYDPGNKDLVAGALSWTVIIGGIIALAVGVALAVSVPVLLAALLAVGLIVLMLIARQALLVLLITISPLAFVAYLLPNTEVYFKKWYKMFSTLLLLFPIIGTVFGASRLAATIINNAAVDYDATTSKPIYQVLALGVSVVPFFIVPSLLKGSLSAAGAIGAKLQGMSNKATGKVSARAKDSSYAGAYLSQRKKLKAASRAQGYGKGIHGYVSRSRASGRAGTELASMGSALASREEKEAVDNEIINMQKQPHWNEANRLDMAREEFVQAMRSGDSTKARAAQQIMLSSGNAGITALQKSMKDIEGDANYGSMMSSNTGQKVLSDLNGAGIKGKNAALAKLAYSPAGTGITQLASDGKTYADLNDAELAGQSDDNIRAAITDGGMTQTRAQEIMDNQNVWSQLSETKKSLVRNQAANASATQSASQRVTNIYGQNGAYDQATAEEARRNAPPTP